MMLLMPLKRDATVTFPSSNTFPQYKLLEDVFEEMPGSLSRIVAI